MTAHRGDTAGYEQHAGAVYMVSGTALTGTVEAFFADWTLEGAGSDDYLGWAVTGVGDEDGDGFADLLVGARAESSYGYQAGAAYLFRGPVSGTQSVEEADAAFLGGGESWSLSWALSSGDVTGDGWPDMLLGAPGKESGAQCSGSGFVVPGGGF